MNRKQLKKAYKKVGIAQKKKLLIIEYIKKIDTRLAHIESLLQRMPEMTAAAHFIEEERKEGLDFMQRYSE